MGQKNSCSLISAHTLDRVNSAFNCMLVWWLPWNVFVLTQTKMNMLNWFLKKGKENTALTEGSGIKVSGFWPGHKWVKYLEQIYDTLSMEAGAWSECRGTHYTQCQVQDECLLEYWLLSDTKRLHLFKPCWQGSACWQGSVVCSSWHRETLKA